MIMKDKFDTNIVFENDETIVGRWQVLGAVEKKEDYLPGRKILMRGVFFEELYFLPDGEGYGMSAWTKNRIKVEWNDGYLLCPYETQEIDGELYMFLDRPEKTIRLIDAK